MEKTEDKGKVNHKAFIVLFFFSLSLAGLIYYIPFAIQSYAEEQAANDLHDSLKQITILRKYYTESVVQKVKGHNDVLIDSNYKGRPSAIPLPNTLVHDLSNEFRKIGVSLQIYSPYPFKNRSQRTLTPLQKNVWEWVNLNPSGTYVGKEQINGNTIIHVAVADKMTSEKCVACHKQHPDSPTGDWQVGDVRAVLSASKNIQESISAGKKISRHVVIVLIALFAFALLLFYLFNKKEQSNQKMHYLANHDALTGLPNRHSLTSTLEKKHQHIGESSARYALFFIDLDDFKPINDQFGHNAGDHVLKTIAKRLDSSVRCEDSVSRLGGDEFCVLFANIYQPDDIETMAKRIIADINQPILFQDQWLQVSCSIGIVTVPDFNNQPSALIDTADKAMYEAKHRGKNQFYYRKNDNADEELISIPLTKEKNIPHKTPSRN